MKQKQSGAKLQIKKSKKDKKSIEKDDKSEDMNKSVIKDKSQDKKKDKKKDKDDKKKDKDDKKKKQKQEKKKDKQDKKKDKGDKKKEKQDKKSKKDKGKGESLDKTDAKSEKKKKDKKDKKDKKLKRSKSKSSMADSQAEAVEEEKPDSLLGREGDSELATISNIHSKEQQAKMRLSELIQQYKAEAERVMFLTKGHDEEKERKIQARLEQLQKQKQRRHQRLEQLEEHREEMQKSKQKQKELKKELRQQRIREKKVKRIEEKLQTIQNSARQRKQQHEKFIQYVGQKKKMKPRWRRYEDQAREKKEEQEVDFRDQLDENKRKYEPMNKEDLDNFEENYQRQREESSHYRNNKITLEQKMIDEENKRMQQLHYKGRGHKVDETERDLRQRKKEEPKNKLEAMMEYGKIIVEELRKKGDEEGKEEEQKEQQKEEQEVENQRFHVVERQKYHQGVNYGIVKQEIKKTLPLEERVKIGNDFLFQIRQLNKGKARKNRTVDYRQNSRSIDLGSSTLRGSKGTYVMRKLTNPYYSSRKQNDGSNFESLEGIEYEMDHLRNMKQDRKLNDQIIKHGEYADILQIQERKRKAGSMLANEVNEKLNILEKL